MGKVVPPFSHPFGPHFLTENFWLVEVLNFSFDGLKVAAYEVFLMSAQHLGKYLNGGVTTRSSSSDCFLQ
jgi:hypothetical protein